ncbi:cytidine deaminase-like fold-containing protein, partial [Enterobacter roggenkampii]|uniref:cytidine deaminase-like fold-containing protein n=1 Tax=Enterobacter roggenkampii TaxID=1812935 RepID=UPI001EEBA14D
NDLFLDGKEGPKTLLYSGTEQRGKIRPNGKDMFMSVSGEKIFSYYLSDIKIMAERSGLKSLTLFDETTGRTLYWQSGIKGFRVKGANDE